MCIILLGATAATQAQIFTEQSADFIGMHRTTPSIADYNNDGRMDIYYGGMTWLMEPQIPNWHAQGFLYTANAEGGWDMLQSNLDDEEGIFRANGLPPTVWAKILWLDADNDGNLDFMANGKSDGDLQVGEEGTDKQYVWLFRNGGKAAGWQFAPVQTGIMQSIDNQRGGDNPDSDASFVDLGDYDNDGFTDYLMQGERNWKEGEEAKWERYVKLYRNNGDGTFTEQMVFNPLPYDVNPVADKVYEIEIGENDETTVKPLMKAVPMSGGAIRFADLNGNGLLDIITAGWVNDYGNFVCIYENKGDGTFQQLDMTGTGIAAARQGDIAIADFNNDGHLDIFISGWSDSEGRRADVYINTGEGGFSFTRSTAEAGNGLLGINGGVAYTYDLNCDGLTDIVHTGYTDSKGFGTYVYFQNTDGTFTEQTEAKLPYVSSGGIALGDLYGRNTLDAFTIRALWADNQWSLLSRIHKNEFEENTPPTAPADVKADATGGKLVISWNAASDEQTDATGLGYNVYIKNKDTGKISMLLPANTETGKLLTIRDLQTLVRSSEASLSYSINITEGNYEIGVQAVDPSGAGGKFATATATATGIRNTGKHSGMRIETVAGGIIVGAESTQGVTVYDAAGRTVAKGTTGTLIPVGGKGVMIVKTNGITAKITK